MSDVVVTFDAKNYTAGPTDVLPVTILDFADSDAGKTWVGDIKQGATCNLTINGNNLPMTGIMTATGSEKKRMEAILSRLLPADILFWQTSPISHSASGQ